jgi:hypothetical protein
MVLLSPYPLWTLYGHDRQYAPQNLWRREAWNERRSRMVRRPGLLPIVCLLLVLTPLTGCGSNATTGTAVSPAASMAPSPPPRTGSVTVGTHAATYRAGDAIAVTLSNHSLQTILFPDHLTSCTVVLLQRQVNASWESINLCKLMIVTRMHALDAGHSLTVRLAAPSNQWLPGLYRVQLSYTASGQANHVVTISSAVFQVH